jgi:hypothetical protein
MAGAEARVGEVVERWGASDKLVAATVALGFDARTATVGLKAELDAWAAPGALRAVMAAEAGAMAGRALPERVLVVAARTLPASTMRQLLWARLLGASVWLKPAQGQEALAEALRDGEGAWLRSLGAGRGEGFRAAIGDADAVVVLGSDETVATLRGESRPGAAFVGYGHRVSGALISADESEGGLRALAEDCVAWDHSGCLAPRVVWVRGDEGAVMSGLGRALEQVAAGLPALSAEEAHAQRVAMTRAKMLGRAAWSGAGFALIGGEGGASTGRRVVHVVREFSGGPLALAEVLSTLGLGKGVAPPVGLPESVRVCALGQMQRPGLEWRQDGLRPLAVLTREAAEDAAAGGD